jgi:hypothetical protein
MAAASAWPATPPLRAGALRDARRIGQPRLSILDIRDRLAYSEPMAVVLVIGVIGFALDGAARALHAVWRR